MTFGQIVRRLFLYFGLALAALAIFALVFALSIRTHIDIPFRWVMLATFTCVLLLAMIKTYRRYWNRKAFWFACFGLLLVHLAVFIPVLNSFPDFRPFWWVPIIIAEGGIFGATVGLLVQRPAK